MKMIKIFCSLLFIAVFFQVSSQSWNEPIYVSTTGSNPAFGLFGASGTGSAGIYFDASNGDGVGGDYASVLQMDDLSVQLNNYSPNPIYFRTAHQTRMTILGNGKIGIGTASPSNPLHLQTDIQDISLFSGLNSSGLFTDRFNRVVLRNLNGQQSWIGIEGTGSNAKGYLGIEHWQDSSPKVAVTWDKNGNVGIGTRNPGNYKLSIHASDDFYSNIRLSNNANVNSGIQFGNVSRVSNDAEIWNWENGFFRIATNNSERFRILSNGKIGIGTPNPDEILTVNGTIHSSEVKVDLSVPGPDYVFEDDYDLRSLKETETYIKENKHLPEIPSAKEMEANGVVLGEMNMLLLKKIEELTLYVIELKKENLIQQKEIENLKNQ